MSLVCSMHLCQQWLLKIHIVHPRMHASDTCVSHQDFRLSKERFGISIDCGWHRTSFLEPPTCDHWQSNVYHMLNSEPTLSKRCTFEQSLLQSLGYTCWLMVICPIQFLHQNSSMVNVEPSDRQCPTDQCGLLGLGASPQQLAEVVHGLDGGEDNHHLDFRYSKHLHFPLPWES